MKQNARSLAAACLVVLFLPAILVQTATARACPDDLALAELIAASDFVVVGKMEVPELKLSQKAGKDAPDYLEIPIRIESAMKGDIGSGVSIRHYPKDRPYSPTNADLRKLSGKSSILFLTKIDIGAPGFYFAGYSRDALKPATDLQLAAVGAEVIRQQEVLHSWHTDTSQPHFSEVQALLSKLGQVSGTEQQQIFDRLEGFGTEAVPTIIAQVDDRRPLATPAIALTNGLGAFEGVRHYGPKLVVDALVAILGQITGKNFGDIVNGGSDRQRNNAIAAWRIYASDLACH